MQAALEGACAGAADEAAHISGAITQVSTLHPFSHFNHQPVSHTQHSHAFSLAEMLPTLPSRVTGKRALHSGTERLKLLLSIITRMACMPSLEVIHAHAWHGFSPK